MKKPEVIEVHQDAPSLASKVEQGEDGVDEAAFAEVEQGVVAGLQFTFLAEADEDLKAIEHHYKTIKALPPDERKAAAMRDLFAVAHGLRGQGGSFGFPLVTTIAASLNRFIEAQAAFDDSAMAAIGKHVAALRTVLGKRLSGDGGPEGAALLHGLE